VRRFRAAREARAVGDQLYMFLVQIIFFAYYIHTTSVPTSVLIVNVSATEVDYGNLKKKKNHVSESILSTLHEPINNNIIITPSVLVGILYYKLL